MTLGEMQHYNKFWVALIMAALVVLDQVFGVSFPWLSEAWVTAILAAVTPILVLLIPNRPA